jgi:carbamoyl-phosphate synthase large subunit
VLGTSPVSIDNAEDRFKFSMLLDSLGIDQPEWKELTSVDEAKGFSSKVGYPVLVRPSYVLSGAAMSVAHNDDNLAEYLDKAAEINTDYPVVISKFIENAKEIEIDAVARDGELVAWAISEHVEKAGVHSGDATMVLPPQNTYIETIRRIKNTTRKISRALSITGPFNIQYIAKENELKVIECNLRASRSFPFVSKVTKTNFIDLAVKAMLGMDVTANFSALDLDYVGVKSPQFSFTRLTHADPILGVEMASTGEVACLGDDLNEAFLKASLSTGIGLPKKNVMLSIGGEKNKYRLLESIKALRKEGFRLFVTEHTSEFLSGLGIPNTMVYKAHNAHKDNNVLSLMDKRLLDFVVVIPNTQRKEEVTDGYRIRRKAVDHSIPLLTDVNIARLFIHALTSTNSLEIKAWDEYE